jgi:lipid II isoglutaminyl synthase (glutamine-hydrolysing)
MVVFNIKVQTFTSIITSKIILNLSKTLFKGGTNFPGKAALKIDKNILETIAKNYEVILITGTNGKTTTTSMINNIFCKNGDNVITNSSGANMFSGITTCFIDNYKFIHAKDKKYAIIEIDEANVKYITEFISPKIICITNLFRDQLDRYGEVYTTLNKILEGVKKSPDSLLILNGDESLLGKLDLPNKKVYYGFKCPIDNNTTIDVNADAKFCKFCKTNYKYNFITYNHLGDYYCEKCGYSRPKLDYYVNDIINQSESNSAVKINNEEIFINQPGTYNIYNALCAYTVSRELNINNNVIRDSLKNVESSFGRQETIKIDDKEVKIILVKNPAGYDQAINTITLDNRKINIAFMLNDNYADGRDVSWIWDVNFEKLTSLNIDKIMLSGIRLYDIGVRLKVAGFNNDEFYMCNNYEELLNEIIACNENTVYILATYTAMTSFRKFLHNKKYIKKLW